MYNIPIGDDLIKEWGITLDGYESGGWGNVSGDFRVYRSLVTVYTYEVKPTDPEWQPEYANAVPAVRLMDRERLIKEIAIPLINALYATFEVLRILTFDKLFDGVKDQLRNGVYAAIQLALTNRNVLERVTTLTRSGGSIQVNQGESSEIVPLDLFGLRGNNLITNSGIMQYDIIDTKQEAVILSEKGNLIIGKFDETLIPDLTR